MKSQVLSSIAFVLLIFGGVADGPTGLQVIDVSDPANPVLAGEYDSPGWSVGVFATGDYAYLCDGSSGLQIFDVSGPATPLVVGNYDASAGARGVFVTGQAAYLVADTLGLEILDLSVHAVSCGRPAIAIAAAVEAITFLPCLSLTRLLPRIKS